MIGGKQIPGVLYTELKEETLRQAQGEAEIKPVEPGQGNACAGKDKQTPLPFRSFYPKSIF